MWLSIKFGGHTYFYFQSFIDKYFSFAVEKPKYNLISPPFKRVLLLMSRSYVIYFLGSILLSGHVLIIL